MVYGPLGTQITISLSLLSDSIYLAISCHSFTIVQHTLTTESLGGSGDQSGLFEKRYRVTIRSRANEPTPCGECPLATKSENLDNAVVLTETFPCQHVQYVITMPSRRCHPVQLAPHRVIDTCALCYCEMQPRPAWDHAIMSTQAPPLNARAINRIDKATILYAVLCGRSGCRGVGEIRLKGKSAILFLDYQGRSNQFSTFVPAKTHQLIICGDALFSNNLPTAAATGFF